MKKMFLVFLFAVTTSLVLSRCNFMDVPVIIGDAPTASPTLDVSEEFSIPPSPTPIPTLTADNANQLHQLLQKETCNLPCYLETISKPFEGI